MGSRMPSRIVTALMLAIVWAAVAMTSDRFTRTSAAAQIARPPATPPSSPVFLQWPLPATGTAYGTIDGARLWQYVKEHGDIAERFAILGNHRGYLW